MNLTQRQLLMFVTTASLGHITRASEALHISQPGLSRALREMEAQLGVALFQRTTRQLTLTPAGLAWLPLAQRLLRDMAVAVASLQTPEHRPPTTVSVAVGTALGCTVMPLVVDHLRRTQPGIRLRLIDDNSAGITSRVVRAEVDIGIGSLVGDSSRLICHKLLSAPIGLLALPQRYAWTQPLSAEEANQLPLLKEPADTSIAQALALGGSDVLAWMNQGTEVSSLALQLALAQAGQGVAVVSALGASHPGAQGLVFTPLLPAVQRTVYLMLNRTTSGTEASEATALVVEAVHSALVLAALNPLVQRTVRGPAPPGAAH